MNKLISKKQLLGLYILIIGLGILLKIIFPFLKFYFFLLLLFTILSIHLIILSLKKNKNKKLIISGLTLFLTSIFFLLYLLLIKQYIDFNYIWPILGLFPSFSLIIYYLISNKKSPHTIIPGIFIGFSSIILLLNINGIMIIDFISFLLILIAFMFIITGLYLLFHNNIKNVKKNKDDDDDEIELNNNI